MSRVSRACWFLSLVLAVFVPTGCAGQKNSASSGTALDLGDGRQVKVLDLMRLSVANRPSERILLLNYETSIDPQSANVQALHNEALEVWDRFRPEVERQGYTEAALRANAPKTGSFAHIGRQYGFFFKKRNGQWIEIHSKTPTESARRL